MHCVAWIQIALLWVTAKKEIDSPWALILSGDSLGDDVKPFLPRFLLQNLSSRIVRSTISIPTSRAFGKSSVLDGPGFSCEELRIHNERSYQSPPVLGAARATIPAERTVFTTQNQTSGSGTWMWLETTALTSARCTIPATAPSPRAHPLLHCPSQPRRFIRGSPSPNLTGFLSGVSQTPNASS